jgi:hypothetical protein
MVDEERDFCLSEDVCETAKHALKAIVADFTGSDAVPSDEEMMAAVERFIGKMPALHRKGWQWLVRALEMSPLAMGYRRKFSNLSRSEQVEVLQRYEASSNYIQRGTVLGLKNVLVLIFFTLPQVERLVGYDHNCLLEK